MFRFSIRDLLFVMSLAGLALGWVIDHRVQVAAKEEYRKGYEQAVVAAEYAEARFDNLLTPFGFGIERGPHGEVLSVTLPPYVHGVPDAASVQSSSPSSR